MKPTDELPRLVPLDGATLVKARIAALKGALELRTGQDTAAGAVERARVLLGFLLDGTELDPRSAPRPAGRAPGGAA